MSDFYIPEDQIALHKIQSRSVDKLELSLDPVPKKLGLIKSHYCPEATVISFKVIFSFIGVIVRN